MYKKLAAVGAPPATFGRFHLSLLERGLWTSQTRLARDLGVSTAMVSRAIAAANLPAEIHTAIGDPGRLSYKAVRRIALIIESIGLDIARERAAIIPSGTPVSDIESALLTGKLPHRSIDVRVRVGKGNKHLVVESACLEDLILRIPQLEQLIQAMISPPIGR
ncbi:hypothetical protein [Paraburkholderia rhizosphaerae]|uniref:hypothetical protein n=1 Tax=Paraburkholderia rhizosphaerae TaxID=480658 RepID=UPI001064F1FC|nr:hypothetical protein [Paraburkholderia rhizosphaerae]